MTPLGKILVFVNLVFSVVVTALILMVFITQANWKAGYTTVLSQLTSERISYNNAIAARNALEEEKNKRIAQLEADNKDKDGREVAARKDAETARAGRDAAVEEKDKANLTSEAAQSASRRMKAEVETLDKRLSESTQKIIDLETTTAEAKKVATNNLIQNKFAQERNVQLVNLLEQREKDLARVRGERAAQAGNTDRNPPPEDLRGQVTQTSGELLTINLGSDSGLTKGNTLEVFRLAPKPTYLGTLRILNVRPNEAVGKLIGPAIRGLPQTGDEVASEIQKTR